MDMSSPDLRKHLRKLGAIAMTKQGVWPSPLCRAVHNADLAGKGLVVCAIDARGPSDRDVKLQIPISTEFKLAPLCKLLRQHPQSLECARQLRSQLGRKVALAFQFVPTDVWKGRLERQELGFHVTRQALKAKNVTVLLVWFILPPRERQGGGREGVFAVMETLLLRPGATVPNTSLRLMTTADKEAMYVKANEKLHIHFADEDYIAKYMKSVGLDPEVLRHEPMYQKLLQESQECLQRFYSREEHVKACLIKAWYPQAAEVEAEMQNFDRCFNEFMLKKQEVVFALWNIMGPEQIAAALRSLQEAGGQEDRHKEAYVAEFGRQFAKPCPTCGKPLDSRSGYPCGCNRPPLPRPQMAQPPPPAPAASTTAVAPTYRRSKNIQTGFTQTSQQKQKPHQKFNSKLGLPQAAASGPAPSQTHRQQHKDKQTKGRYNREPDPTMIRLREQALSHRPKELTPSQVDTSSSSSSASRRSRREVPQGDHKLSGMLAFGELLREIDAEAPSGDDE